MRTTNLKSTAMIALLTIAVSSVSAFATNTDPKKSQPEKKSDLSLWTMEVRRSIGDLWIPPGRYDGTFSSSGPSAPNPPVSYRFLVELTVTPSGDLRGARIVKTDAPPALSVLVVPVVERAAPFPTFVSTQNKTVIVDLTLNDKQTSSQQDKSLALKLRDEAIKEFRNGKPDEAIKQCESASKMCAANFAINSTLAWIYNQSAEQTAEPQKKLSLLRKVFSLKAVANALQAQERYDKVLQSLNLNSQSEEDHVKLALQCSATEDFEGARDEYERALLCHQKGKPPAAGDSTTTELQTKIAECKKRLANEQTVFKWRAAVESSRTNQNLFFLAQALANAGRAKEAMEICEQVIGREPGNEEVSKLLSQLKSSNVGHVPLSEVSQTSSQSTRVKTSEKNPENKSDKSPSKEAAVSTSQSGQTEADGEQSTSIVGMKLPAALETKSPRDQVIWLNNRGVEELKLNNFADASGYFEEALRKSFQHGSGYALAQENLAIGLNNYGISLQNYPERALPMFVKSVFYDPGASVSTENLETTLKALGKDPGSFNVRIALADEAAEKKDWISAVVHYQAALALKEETAVRTKLNQASEGLRSQGIKFLEKPARTKQSPTPVKDNPSLFRYREQAENRLLNGLQAPKNVESGSVSLSFKIERDGTVISPATFNEPGKPILSAAALATLKKIRKLPPIPSDLQAPLEFSLYYSKDLERIWLGVTDLDFGPYMADMQRRLKSKWFPPRHVSSYRLTVKFIVHRDGTVSNVALTKSSGLPAADTAGLAAVRNSAPLRPLPLGAPRVMDIEFTFDYFNDADKQTAGASGLANAAELDRAKASYTGRQFAQAVKEFGMLVQKYPNDQNVHYYLGLSCMESGMKDKAKTEFEWVMKNCTDKSLTEYAQKVLVHLRSTKTSKPPN